jgi:hypothetical protein
MTTFQDKQPQSRRALRQEERAERPLTEDVDAPGDSETPRVSGRPTGRRARSNFADGLIEVSGSSTDDRLAFESSISLPVPAEAEVGTVDSAPETPAETTGDVPVESPSDDAPVWAGPSFGFRAPDFDASVRPPLTDDDSADSAAADAPAAAEADDAPIDEILASTPAADDSSVARAFPFASQVEATSDDAGHQTFELSEFAPELAHTDEPDASADVAPADEAPADETPADETPADETPASVAQVDEATPVGEPIVVDEPVAPVDPVVVAPEERTMTRREWRAWRAQQEAAGAAAPIADAPAAQESVSQPAAIPPLVEPEETPAPKLSDAMAEFEALTRAPHTAPVQKLEPATFPVSPDADEPAEASASTTGDVPAPEASAIPSIFSVPQFSAPVPPMNTARSEPAAPPEAPSFVAADVPAPAPEASPVDEHAVAPAAEAPVAEPASVEKTAEKPVEKTAETPAEAEVAESAAESAYVPPVGHWSRQAALDDESQPFENTLSRDVGGGNVATTTNALVLPMIPQRDDFSSMINSTGEIMVTGTIDLPMSVGATGRDSRHYDDPEVDHLFDEFDNEIASTDSAPVRAITAVSSHTATRGGIESSRKQSNRMLTVLLVTACVMAVGVVGLLVAGFVFRIF